MTVMDSSQTIQAFTVEEQITPQPSFIARAWRRLQYPAGPHSRERLHAWREHLGHGW